MLLEVLSHWAKLEDMDFVLICFCKLNYDAALRVRKQRPCFFTDDVLSKKLKQKAVILAQQARSGHIAIFVGAGYLPDDIFLILRCSLSSGLPSWNALLSNLGKLGGMSDEEVLLNSPLSHRRLRLSRL